jgi:hypothetical protein
MSAASAGVPQPLCTALGCCVVSAGYRPRVDEHECLLPLYMQAAPGSRQSPGLSIVLSDQLLRQFPDLQLGSGLSHFAAVRDQAQGAENLNYVALSQR